MLWCSHQQGKWRHWGCTTARVLANLKSQTHSPGEIDGFNDLRDEDRERVQMALAMCRVAQEDIPATACRNGEKMSSQSKETVNQQEGRLGEQIATNDHTGRAASLSNAAECLARAATKLSEAAQAMSLAAEALSRGSLANTSKIGTSMGSLQRDRADSWSSVGVAQDEESVGLPQSYRLLLDDGTNILHVLCSLLYERPKAVCYITCGASTLKFYKTLIDSVTEANAIIPEPHSQAAVDLCFERFFKDEKSILLFSETDIPSRPAKNISEYTVVHVGWPVDKCRYVAQRRVHRVSSDIILAYSGDEEIYLSGPAIICQTIAWLGYTEGFRASTDILRPLFEEILSELSLESKEEAYMDWIQLHALRGPRFVSSWSPNDLLRRANHFLLGSFAYKSPRSFAERSSHQVPPSNLLPEVSLEFVTQFGLQPAVEEGLLRVELEVEVDGNHDSDPRSVDQLSAEDTRIGCRGLTPLGLNRCQLSTAYTNNKSKDQPEIAQSPVCPLPSTVVPPPGFTSETEITYFALDEEFDALPLVCFLTNQSRKVLLFLEGGLMRSYMKLFREVINYELIAPNPKSKSIPLEIAVNRFISHEVPAILLLDHATETLPPSLQQISFGCSVYWARDLKFSRGNPT
ncbi:unnamed protein product [Rhizoctonia solani]|uniref:PARP-type domain-containing protein n=1 Tax=Rhizoctonia solani TaxID=456999 RepID=A0A8H3GHA6_9AGAM|nr:unnamed protein product [Rhizoctonia solani]